MSQSAAIGAGVGKPGTGKLSANAAGCRAVADPRRALQLALAAVWLFDAILQFQSAMFTKGFSRMLAASAAGNPVLIARPIEWSAALIGQHAGPVNATFAAVQLALGLGIAWRPTVRIALAASMLWAGAVWWLGEGLGGILTGAASPVNGAPGAALIYVLLAVLLWPARPGRPSPFTAGLAVGTRAARALWLLLWGSLAAFALQPAARAPQAISHLLASAASGQPGWLTWLDSHGAALLANRGLLASALLAAALAMIATGPYLPPAWARAALSAAVVVAAFIWLAEGLGGILTGMGTDPNSGPLLILLALAYWPRLSTAGPGAG